MWTICWSDSRGDHWERGSAERLMGIIRSYRIETSDEDVLIFSPDADDCTVPISDFIQSYSD